MYIETKLIQFVVTKAIYIESNLFFENYINKNDIVDIQSWDIKDQIAITRTMRSRKNKNSREYCPWCLKYKMQCKNCSYGKRHGKCFEPDSDFTEIMRLLLDTYGESNLFLIPGLKKELDLIINEDYNIDFDTFRTVINIV